ncbi:hypothetical protein ACLOJK_006618 [Asimina triloba]
MTAVMAKTGFGSDIVDGRGGWQRRCRAEATSADSTGGVVDDTGGVVDGLDCSIQASPTTEMKLFGFYQNQRLDGFKIKILGVVAVMINVVWLRFGISDDRGEMEVMRAATEKEDLPRMATVINVGLRPRRI